MPGQSDETHQIWLARTDGSMPVQLTPDGARSENPTWFESAFVYFTGREPGGCASIFRIARHGGPVERVVRQQGDESVFQPSVASDGRVAYGSADCEVRLACCELEVVDRQGRATNDLAQLPDDLEAPGLPAWSLDGEMIAFQTGYDPGIVWVARRDGSELQQVSPDTLSASSPAWSPDGEWIAFEGVSFEAKTTDVYIARVDGSELKRFTETLDRSESSPTWIG